MRAIPFLSLLIFCFILTACNSQAAFFADEEVDSIRIEGCGLDGFVNKTTSLCERELAIEEKQAITDILASLKTEASSDGPVTAIGSSFVFTVVQDDGESFECPVWLEENHGNFEKPGEEDIRYLLEEGEAQRIFEIIETGMQEDF